MESEIELTKSWFELAKILATIAGFLGIIARIFIGFFSANFLQIMKGQKSTNVIFLNFSSQIHSWIKIFNNGLLLLHIAFFLVLLSFISWNWGHNLLTRKYDKTAFGIALWIIITVVGLIIGVRMIPYL